MSTRLHSWWLKAKKPLKICAITVGCLLLVALVLSFIGGYFFNWTWTGFGPYVSPPHPQDSDFQREKTLYDWLQLAIIPVALAFGVLWLTRLQQQRDQKLADQRAESEQAAAEKRAETEREIALDNQREAALQGYIHNLSELLLKEHLSELKPEYEEVRTIARVRTLTALRRLDPVRKGSVLQFLQESGLISRFAPIIVLSSGPDWIHLRVADLSYANLQGADLHNANLSGINLHHADLYRSQLPNADLSQADLRDAKLIQADLSGAALCGADLSSAKLMGANLTRADLTEADLTEADLAKANLSGATGTTTEQLKKAKSLQGATLPDGKIHP